MKFTADERTFEVTVATGEMSVFGMSFLCWFIKKAVLPAMFGIVQTTVPGRSSLTFTVAGLILQLPGQPRTPGVRCKQKLKSVN